MSDTESTLSPLEIRLECLRMVVEFDTRRNIMNPVGLADKYYNWVMSEGSGEIRPQDHRKDDSHKSAQKTRSVRTIR